MQKVHGGFTNIKQVSIRKHPVLPRDQWGSMLATLRVEHRYIVRKSEISLDMGEPTFHAKKTACYRLQQQTEVHVLALVQRTTLENCTKSTQGL